MVNVVTGFGSEVGEPLVTHPQVAKIAFTGGDATGQRVYELAARGIKPVTLELGGKSAEHRVRRRRPRQRRQGRGLRHLRRHRPDLHRRLARCWSSARIHDDVHREAARAGQDRAHGQSAGLDTTQVGPITTRPQYKKVLDYIEIAKGEGAACVLGGGARLRPECGDGWFVEPTIFTGVKPEMRIAQEEVFGPVLSVIPFEDEDEAIAIANDTLYGLAAGRLDPDIRRALQMAERLRPAPSGSTPIGRSATCRRSAATNVRASAARAV